LDVDWASLHKILSDTTRRSILKLLTERESLAYTDIMTLLQITNTGRLNYHLKALGTLISKDERGRYRLTEQGRQAANMLRIFPERVPPDGLGAAADWALAGAIAFFAAGVVYLSLEVLTVFISTQFPLSLWTLTLVLPFAFGVVTMLRVWRPLQKRDTNAHIRRWAIPLAILGIPCGLGAAFVLLVGADDKFSKSQER